MGTPYPLEKKNQILGRILSKEISVEQAHREYGIATSCVYRWLRQLTWIMHEAISSSMEVEEMVSERQN